MNTDSKSLLRLGRRVFVGVFFDVFCVGCDDALLVDGHCGRNGRLGWMVVEE